MRFLRSHRLTTKADYQAVFDKAAKVTQRYLVVLYKPNQKSHARLGMLVGKRAVSDAVERNRIKRTIRESFRHCQNELKGFDIIVIVRHQCDTLNNAKLREGLKSLWAKLVTQYQKSSV